MLHMEKWKIYMVIFLCITGFLYAMPNMVSTQTATWMENNVPSWLPSKTVNLGLDLRGGSHILLQADTDAVVAERMQSYADAARIELRKERIGYQALRAKDNGISVRLRDLESDRSVALKIIRDLHQDATVNVTEDGTITLTLSEKAISDITGQIINQSIEIVRRRVDESGTKEPIIQRQGQDRIVVQLPGVDDPERIKALIGKTAKMGFHLVDFDSGLTGKASAGAMRLPMRENPAQQIAIRKRVMVSGASLIDAQPGFGQSGEPIVSFRFDTIGSKKFCNVTRDHVGKPFAIVLDGEVISAPVIRDAICGGSGQISGGFTVKEANDLALLLRAGALPAPLNVVEERSVGPSLGSDSIAAGKKAGIYGFCVIFVFMVLAYGLFGFFANVALIFNVLFIFALLSILQATLTLPGIAGIILTIGMAVDANVLVYERIREELAQGRSVMSAVDTGYNMSWSTIVDANITTLIVAIILFSFGTGPVKGFAVAMSLGIVTSVYSAIMLTRLMIIIWLRKTRPSTLKL